MEMAAFIRSKNVLLAELSEGAFIRRGALIRRNTVLVDDQAKIVPCIKTLNFVLNNKRSHVYFTQFHKNGPSRLIKQVY